MLRLASDADVHGAIVRGLRRRRPEIDLVRVSDVLGDGTPDDEVLSWAAAENRILITNDRNTMVATAYEKTLTSKPMPGIIVTSIEQSIGAAIDDILLIADCASDEEIRQRIVMYLPLR